MMYRDEYARQAKKDAKTAKQSGLKDRFDEIVEVIRRDPYEPTPGHGFEMLLGELRGAYSRRLNYHNRFVYTVHRNIENHIAPQTQKPYDGVVRVHSAWGHTYAEIDKGYLKDSLRFERGDA